MESTCPKKSSGTLFKLDPELQNISLGSSEADFSRAPSYITRSSLIPEKKQYPVFKKTFWEEPIYNPSLANTSQSHEYEAYAKEQELHWKNKGKRFDLQSRLVSPKPVNERGPVKPNQYPQFFEKGQKYFGRQRKILPYLRAQIYTRPLERCDPEVKKKISQQSNKVLVGPGTYDLGDFWKPKTYSAVGPTTRPSSFMETKSKRDLNEFYGIRSKDYEKTPRNSSTPPSYKQPKSSYSFAAASHSSARNLPATPVDRNKRRTHSAGEVRPRSPGVVFNKSSLEHSGISADMHFVRMKESDGSNLIVPVCNHDEEDVLQRIQQASPVDTWAQPHTPKNDLIVASSPAPGVSTNNWPFDESSAVEMTDAKQPIPSPIASSRVGSRHAMSRGSNVTARLPTPHAPRCGNKEYLSPRVSKRTLSYDQLQREKKLASFVKPDPNDPTKIALCVSEKVAIAPPNIH
mmetsp:Transcript_7211/g.10729  ORF Transcript_7211/g.10729 Transcript_7211/m.10729 type:complete len:460 (-) Transcript_7211:101-1480(-)|eukprot:CAMPEP_0185037740 /NCGR_PEP_ID=MMETSP1103-20130426/32548_1 /TAXON_ID=36769 /ORGANISM="Paraphysomonas bandaiensis, Strain Caron Lab Isolate" /LENGTH=459 /DNA_ID=CAMNT_0027575853 /DNA_START=221 /DNA_END=1600 /DNA_ORIENTATION=+